MTAKWQMLVGAALAALFTVGCGAGRRGHPKPVDPSAMAVPAGLPGSAQPAPAGRPNAPPGIKPGPMAMYPMPSSR